MKLKKPLYAEQQARHGVARQTINKYPNLPKSAHAEITRLVTNAETLEKGRQRAEYIAKEITQAREANQQEPRRILA